MNERVINKSKEYFNSGLGCAESVLLAITEAKNIQSELIPGIATGFCGGISRTNNMCGAVTGAIIAINLLYGRNKAGDPKEENFNKVQGFLEEFRKTFGTINCTELTGCDLSTESGREKFEVENINLKCTEFTGEATRIALEIIN
ncbi:MAG: C_GCAxxG_C_C family protein [Bacteroidetes bacterium]|nr:C_GCAxxG_C_C family protein [Bacteroidota bacterium]MBL7102953.1 C_GCAxxG_C_C family protein [Bacteroidales bacterium]